MSIFCIWINGWWDCYYLGIFLEDLLNKNNLSEGFKKKKEIHDLYPLNVYTGIYLCSLELQIGMHM